MTEQKAASISIRRPAAAELVVVKNLVQSVVDEIYGGLWADPPLPIGDQDYTSAWIAVSASEIVGVVLTQDDSVDDLWIVPKLRSAGVGTRLLQHAEAEIAARGYRTSKLRVMTSNQNAVSFYKKHGWTVQREFAHETFPVSMLEMHKFSGELQFPTDPKE